MSSYDKKGLERTSDTAAGPLTPEKVPVDIGHLSGGEYNWIHSQPVPEKK